MILSCVADERRWSYAVLPELRVMEVSFVFNKKV